MLLGLWRKLIDLLVGKQRQSHVESSTEAPQNIKAAILLYDYNSGYMPPPQKKSQRLYV